MLQMDKEQKYDIDQLVKFVRGGRTVENRGLNSHEGTIC
jgi:hypothetical protein